MDLIFVLFILERFKDEDDIGVILYVLGLFVFVIIFIFLVLMRDSNRLGLLRFMEVDVLDLRGRIVLYDVVDLRGRIVLNDF